MKIVFDYIILRQLQKLHHGHEMKMLRYSEIPRDISGDSLATLKISEVYCFIIWDVIVLLYIKMILESRGWQLSDLRQQWIHHTVDQWLQLSTSPRSASAEDIITHDLQQRSRTSFLL